MSPTHTAVAAHLFTQVMPGHAAAWGCSRFPPEAAFRRCGTQLAKESGPADPRVRCGARLQAFSTLFSPSWFLRR